MDEIVAVCRKHWAVVLGRVIIAVIVFGFLAQYDGNALYTLVKIGVPLLIIISGIVEYSTNYIGVTRTKVVVHMGFIKTADHSTPLNKIQAISVSSGLFGKIFGYSTITIDHAGTGKSEYRFGHMANAKDFAGVLEHMAGMR